jgi:DNA-binding winged helix-turn-helix (wHTH) protein/Tol biopolymer transport system component
LERGKEIFMSGIYRLGEYEIDSLRRQIRLNGDVVPVAQKPFEVLLYLIHRVGQVVSKEELMEAIWPQAFVEEANLTQSIFLLRKALQDKAAGGRYIVTVPGRGYQLGVAVVEGGEGEFEAEPLVAVPAAQEVEPGRTRNWGKTAAVVGVAVLMLGVLGFGGWRMWRHGSGSEATFTLRRLTNSGDVRATAISASGSYVAYVSKDALGAESVSVSDLRSRTSRVILRDEVEIFEDVTFSPDELYLYFRSYLKADPQEVSSEHRVPLLGGEPVLVVTDIDGPVSFLDGGKRVCFWRSSAADTFSFLSADAESGKEERTIASSGRPRPIFAACAPDGEKAAISTEVGGISILDFKTGERKPFYQSAQGNEIYEGLMWRSDGSELIGTAITPFDFYPSVFSVSYPQAERTLITHDIDSYGSPGITAGGETIVARQGNMNAQFQSFNLPLLAVNPEVSSFPWTDFLGWTGDDKIVGSAAEGGIKKKDVEDGRENVIQMPDGVRFLQPNGCGAGSLVAAGSDSAHKGISIWHMDADGSRLEQLTHGPEDILPACSPDGKWVLYADNSFRQKATIYRVSAKGGAAVKVGEGSVWFAVSHTGGRLAWIEDDGHEIALVQADLESGRRIGSVRVPAQLKASRSISFSPDDRHIFLVSRGNTADSIYDLPLNGSAPVKQIEFRGARVAAVAVSPGGKRLGIVTVKPVSDVVLLERSHP